MKHILKIFKLILLHSVFWSSTQLILSSLCIKLPSTMFEQYSRLFKSFSWEKEAETME